MVWISWVWHFIYTQSIYPSIATSWSEPFSRHTLYLIHQGNHSLKIHIYYKYLGSGLVWLYCLLVRWIRRSCFTVGAASQWCSNERMMVVPIGFMMVKCSLMMVKCSVMTLKWVYEHSIISPSLTSILPSIAWCKPSFGHLTIIDKLHRLVLW